MKGLIVFLGTITISIAAPQYNYGQPNNIGGRLYEAPSLSYHDAGPLKKIISKQFYIHSAPNEPDEIGADKIVHIGPGRKHYRVVFIKAPHQGVQAGRVHVVAPSNEEKTVIYVLSKKTDVSDIQADVQQSHSELTKPDVFFIKYKTAEEAAHAQKHIQAQYDSLGGTTQISDEGIAPLTSVIGALDQHSSDEDSSHGSSLEIAAGNSSGYLPPNH